MSDPHPTDQVDTAQQCSAEPGHLCRRAVLTSVGAVGVGVALAGCGAAGDAANSAVSNAASKASEAVTGAVKDAISKASIPVGGGRIFASQKVVVTQPTAGDFKAFTAVCTHQGCIVSDVSGGTINCGCHGSAFDIATGAVTRGPATQPLPTKTITVNGNGLSVN